MNAEQKLNLDLDLVNKSRSMSDEECLKEFMLYVNATETDDRITMLIKGNLVMGANVICERMDSDIQFRQFFLSMLGAYLAKNPNHEEHFMKGLSTLKNTMKKVGG